MADSTITRLSYTSYTCFDNKNLHHHSRHSLPRPWMEILMGQTDHSVTKATSINALCEEQRPVKAHSVYNVRNNIPRTAGSETRMASCSIIALDDRADITPLHHHHHHHHHHHRHHQHCQTHEIIPDSHSPPRPSSPSTALPSDSADLFSQTPPATDRSADSAAFSPPLAPAPSRFRDADSLPAPSPWPTTSPTRVNVGVQDDGRRCPHQDVYPCFCRRDTELQGYACRRCRFERCSVTNMLRYGTAEVLRRALDAEVARARGCQLFEQELRSALDEARRREGGSR
ncbi:hypothetical protein LX36DRAFT_262407 [Colletotrichum falcatum]|nr:hypothetical protein LX36DRAFT_262407 [Colletotrichum falcatum]